MSDDVKMAIVCFAPMLIFAVGGFIYSAWQDWLIADAAHTALAVQKEVYLNMPDKCKECPYCNQKKEDKK